MSAPDGYFDEMGIPVDRTKFYRLAYLAGRLWRPRPLDAAGVLIRANNAADILPGCDHSNGWNDLFVQGLEIVKTAGDHSTMIKAENATELERQLNALLDRHDCTRQTADHRLSDNIDSGFVRQKPMLVQSAIVSDTVS